MTQLHYLWGQATEQPDYDKPRWQKLQAEIEELEAACCHALSALVSLQDKNDGSLVSPTRNELRLLLKRRRS